MYFFPASCAMSALSARNHGAPFDRTRTNATEQAKEAARVARLERIEANRLRVSMQLMSGLAKDVGSGSAELLEGWTVKFDLERVTHDPEGEQRGPPINSRDRSIVFISPAGKKFKSRGDVVALLKPQPCGPSGPRTTLPSAGRPAHYTAASYFITPSSR